MYLLIGRQGTQGQGFDSFIGYQARPPRGHITYVQEAPIDETEARALVAGMNDIEARKTMAEAEAALKRMVYAK